MLLPSLQHLDSSRSHQVVILGLQTIPIFIRVCPSYVNIWGI